MGAHLKALGVLVWILGPESTTARVLLCQSWLQCENQAAFLFRIRQKIDSLPPMDAVKEIPNALSWKKVQCSDSESLSLH